MTEYTAPEVPVAKLTKFLKLRKFNHGQIKLPLRYQAFLRNAIPNFYFSTNQTSRWDEP